MKTTLLLLPLQIEVPPPQIPDLLIILWLLIPPLTLGLMFYLLHGLSEIVEQLDRIESRQMK